MKVPIAIKRCIGITLFHNDAGVDDISILFQSNAQYLVHSDVTLEKGIAKARKSKSLSHESQTI